MQVAQNAELKPSAAQNHWTGELHGRRYIARWAQIGTIEHLRVNLRVEAGESGAAKFHVETLNLYSQRSRRMFATRAAKLFECGVEEVEGDLSELLIAVDRSQRESVELGNKVESEPEPLMTAPEREEALGLLRSENLMERVANDMDALGYVGEDANKKLGYLIAVSRKLPDPLSAVITSQSGAGKSGLASILEKLTPPEEMVFWSRLSPQALYYVERDFLKRKLVVIEERDGSDAADYSIRALQSKQKLVQAVPVKDPATGAIKTRTMEVEGPAAFIETTTRVQLNPENASRCFELYLDESPTQTALVQAAQRNAKTAEGLALRARRQVLERVHQNAQRLLEHVAVVIPYANLLTFPSSWLRARRDNLRLLNLIEAVAFLHQFQRPRHKLADGGAYIEASVEDYAVAFALASGVFGSGLDELKKPGRDLLSVIDVKVRELAAGKGAQVSTVSFTRREVRAWAGLPNHQVKAAMRELEELEIVEVERSVRGSKFTYRLVVDVQSRRAPLAGLVTPVELFNRVNARGSSVRRPVKVEQSGKSAVSTTLNGKNRVAARG